MTFSALKTVFETFNRIAKGGNYGVYEGGNHTVPLLRRLE